MKPMDEIVLDRMVVVEQEGSPMPASANFIEAIQEQIHSCRAYWSNIEVPCDVFAEYVWDIVRKHLKDNSDEHADIEFMKRLYLRDLYLACTCVHRNENAWRAFDLRYRNFVTNLVRFSYRHGTDNEEVADLILVNLFFDDRSGRKRIASYDGRSSLATWLRVIVINRAINERNDRKVTVEESLADLPDGRALVNIESALRAHRYTEMLKDSLAAALRQLTHGERLLLIWRYEENMPLGEVAKLLGIHQANVTRRLIRLQARLREAVIQTLASQYKLGPAAIQECFADVIENPLISVSILGLIKEVAKPASTVPSLLQSSQAAGPSKLLLNG